MTTEPFQRYELGELIGVGAAGVIYRAVDQKTGQVVALKRLNREAAANRIIRNRFSREINILQRLRHPNIIGLVESGRDDSGLYYSMELVEGGTVKSLLDTGGPLPWPIVVELGIQLCSALQCAHNGGVIHRDLKPGNLFLTNDGELKLGDFGIARDLTRADLTEKGQTVGTHAYMAPEQIRGEASVSAKADLYALGCCLFEMLTARKLFRGETHIEIYDQHLKGIPPRARDFSPKCPETLDSLIDQLVSKSPEDRPFNARQVQAKLLQLFSEPMNPDALPRQSLGDVEPESSSEPLSADELRQKSHQLLVDRIRNPHLGAPQEAISGVRLAAIAAIIVAIAAAAVLAKS